MKPSAGELVQHRQLSPFLQVLSPGGSSCTTGLCGPLGPQPAALHSSVLLGIGDQEITRISNYMGHDEKEMTKSIKPQIQIVQRKGCGGRISEHHGG